MSGPYPIIVSFLGETLRLTSIGTRLLTKSQGDWMD